MYWEDVALSVRAHERGVRLYRTNWEVTHLVNQTAQALPGVLRGVDANQRYVLEMMSKLVDKSRKRSRPTLLKWYCALCRHPLSQENAKTIHAAGGCQVD